MQAEEDYEALVAKAKEGDADAIEEWLSSLERDPNSQALLLGPGDRETIAKALCYACASSRPGCVRVARLILESLTLVSVEGLEPAVILGAARAAVGISKNRFSRRPPGVTRFLRPRPSRGASEGNA